MVSIALVPAAGSGSRLGAAMPKQYLPIAGRPMIWHTLRALVAVAAIDRVVVALSPDDRHWDPDHYVDFCERLTVLHCGGPTRADTVANALASIADSTAPHDLILVHDAARPCITPERVGALIAAVADDPVGGLLAVPVADTLKRADAEQRVAATLVREGLWQAQTPQAFRFALLARALETARGTLTDEAGAIERLGLAPRLVQGDSANFKVTLERDLFLAEAVLAARERSCA